MEHRIKKQIYTDIIIGYTTWVTLQICGRKIDILINVVAIITYTDGEKWDSILYHTKKKKINSKWIKEPKYEGKGLWNNKIFLKTKIVRKLLVK